MFLTEQDLGRIQKNITVRNWIKNFKNPDQHVSKKKTACSKNKRFQPFDELSL